MLIIEKNQKIYLPKKFHYINNICSYIYDHLTFYLRNEHQEQLANTLFDTTKDEELREALKNKNLHFLDILGSLENTKHLETVLTKHFTMSILSDMVNYLYESIKIAQKGKMNVAFSLLRKPFTDQLLILEQILIDASEFIDRFFHKGDSHHYDPSSKKLDKSSIIHTSVEKIGLFFYEPVLIFQLRYDKSVYWGLNSITNRALHMVTNDKNYRTGKQDFNFTFPVEKADIDEQLEYFYNTVYALLTYTSEVIDEILYKYIADGQKSKITRQFKRIISSLILMNEKDSSNFFSKLFSKALKTECEICKHNNKFGKRALQTYFFEDMFFCVRCFNPIEISHNKIDFIVKNLKFKREC